MSSSTNPDRITPLVLSAAAALFAASAYNVARTAYAGHRNANQAPSPAALDKDSSASKTSSQSAVARMTYTTRPEDCEALVIGSHQRPKLLAGSLFKLIDIAAGVAARRHSGMACVTISVDSVVLLKPIFLGDLIHVSASVNRAWGSSMEVGVRIVKECLGVSSSSSSQSQTEYVSHSYLTFVAINKVDPKEKQASALPVWSRLWQSFMVPSANTRPPKVILSPIRPTSRLEARRHFLAGRRRQKRLEDARSGRTREGVSVEVKRKVRKEMEELLKEYDESQAMPALIRSAHEKERHNELLRTIELEVIIQAWAQQDSIVTVRGGTVEVKMPGDEPIRFPESEVRAKARELGVRLPGDVDFSSLDYKLNGSATPTWIKGSLTAPSTPRSGKLRLGADTPKRKEEPKVERESEQHSIGVAETITTSMHIVFPQHTNSHGIIFGGNTMSWSEEVARMTCRHLRVRTASQGQQVHWKTVAMDGLEFNVQVGVGELMLLSAIVVRAYAHSCEVYVLAQAEDRRGRRRITNDVLFTMAYDVTKDSATAEAVQDEAVHDKPPIVTQIEMPKPSALDVFAEASQERRKERLELRQMLMRVYGS